MAERFIGGDEELMHMFFLCVECLVNCSNDLGKTGGSIGGLHFWWFSLSTEL
jgi:hypothetical protein